MDATGTYYSDGDLQWERINVYNNVEERDLAWAHS